ncbi:Chemotaxis protein methyltransferase 1 [Candidatus Magnetomoraceae bacterium gMMP-15]
MTNADFDYLRYLVRQTAGIVLEPDKQYLIETRLTPIIQKQGLNSIDHLMQILKSKNFNSLHEKVVEAFATKETLFFRDPFVFEDLKNMVLPELIREKEDKRELNIWSAACASGQEPYSIAMLFDMNFPFLDKWKVKLIASDFSKEALDRAYKGNYSQAEVNRGLSNMLLHKYFKKQGVTWQLKDNIRKKVEFRIINFVEVWPTLPVMDIILMRNVLIYFDINIKTMILNKLKRVLRPGGYLVVGTGESPDRIDNSFKRIKFDKAVVYRLS